MQQVHVARDLAEAYLVKGVLEAALIDAFVRNEHLVGDTGFAPSSPEVRPTVWVADGDAGQARQVLCDYSEPSRPGEALLGLGEALDDALRVGEHRDDAVAHEAMSELFVAATRVARDPNLGDVLDELHRHTITVRAAARPFGIEERTWKRIGELALAVFDGETVGEPEVVRDAARELRDYLRTWV